VLLLQHLGIAFGEVSATHLLALPVTHDQHVFPSIIVQIQGLLRATDDIVSFAAETWAGSIAFGLLHTASIASFAHSLSNAIGTLMCRGAFGRKGPMA